MSAGSKSNKFESKTRFIRCWTIVQRPEPLDFVLRCRTSLVVYDQ